MHFDGDFRKLAVVNTGILCEKARQITEQEWDSLSVRQQRYDVHSSTQTVPLIFDSDFRHRHPTRHSMIDRFQDELEQVCALVREYFEANPPEDRRVRPRSGMEGYFARLILVRMAPESTISGHVDNGFSLSRAHRIHLPIKTNQSVSFSVGNSTRMLPEGELWEINNRRRHSVKNNSKEPRIHMILDYVIPGEVINDPIDGELVA